MPRVRSPKVVALKHENRHTGIQNADGVNFSSSLLFAAVSCGKAQLPQRDRWLVLSGRLHVILRGMCARTTRGDDPKRNKRPESKGETWSMQGHAFTQCMLRWAGPTNLSIKLDCRTKTREKIRDTAVIYTRKETFKTREIRACERACNWSPYQRHGCSYIIEKAVDIPAPIESRSCAVYGRNRRS